MSVSLSEILENAGYDIKNNIDDARWFLGQESEFNELLEKAGELEDDYCEYVDFVETQEELGLAYIPSWEEWKELK